MKIWKTKIWQILLIGILFSVTLAAQNKVVPLINLQVKGLMGGVENGKFLDAVTTVSKIPAQTKYKIFEPGKVSVAEMIFTKPSNSMDVCDDFYGFGEADFNKTENSKGIAVGANAAWKIIPRQPEKINLSDPEYKKAVSGALRAKGIVTKTIKLTQAFRIDLEGDGVEEVLIAATNYAGGVSSSAKKNEYSFILLRKVISGKARNIVVSGDFMTKKVDFGAPSEYAISSIADLNGDGQMELVIYAQYYEGGSVEVFEMKAGKLSSVKTLNVGCGV